MALNQKIEKGGMDGDRYFWKVVTVEAGTFDNYRSRLSTSSDIRNRFKQQGYTVKSVSAVRA